MPWITVAQMREVDRVATDEFGLSLLQMMENAGSRLAGRSPDARRIGADTPEADLLIDRLLGYGQSGAPRGRHAELIAATEGRWVLSLDVPSGLELVTGIRRAPYVTAEVTTTLALPKTALGELPDVVGRVVLADIGIPAAVYRRAGVIPPDVFGHGPLVEIAYVG